MRNHNSLLIKFGLFLALFSAPEAKTSAEIYQTKVNQKTNGGEWVELGRFVFNGSSDEYVEISNAGANGYVIADAVCITGNGITNIIDDADGASVQKEGSWGTAAATKGGYGTGFSHDRGAQGNPLMWVRFFPQVPQAGEYTVSIRWTEHPNRASAAPVSVVYNIKPAPRALTVVNGLGSGSYMRQTEVAVKAAPSEAGKTFAMWRSSNGGSFENRYSPATRFIMPDRNVTVTADYRINEVLEPVRETARELPVAAEVDVAVIGSSIGAIGTAVEAARAGASVLLLSSDYYLGRDMAGENHYWLADGEVPQSGLAKELFGVRPSPAGEYYVTPSSFKKQAESLLISNNVAFLYGTHAVDAVIDGNNQLSGVVIANKGGRQAVKAKIIVDATPMGGFGQIAGAAMEPWPADQAVTVSRTHYKCNSPESRGASVHGDYREFSTSAGMSTGSWVERCRAETQLRDLFDTGNESWSAQYMHVAEPRGIIGEASESAAWPGAEKVNLGICKPRNMNYLYVIGPACSVSRANAEALARPLEALELGRRLGTTVQASATARPAPANLRVKVTSESPALDGMDVSESLSGIRPFQQNVTRIPQPARTLPVDGRYDVIVVGGGSAGTPAAIGAARAGAKVLLIEQLGILGGTGVNGIGCFWKGYKHGFTVEYGINRWKTNGKANYNRKALESAGGEVWFNTQACGVIKSNNTVCGVVVSTPLGRRVILGRVVIDGTGDGDIYAWAGADFEFGGGRDGNFSLQDSGFHGDNADAVGYQNQSGVYTDPGDIYGATWFRVLSARYTKHGSKFDYYPLSGIRATRRLVGDYIITALDQYRGRAYADVIAVASSNWDNHGYHKDKACYAGLFPDGMSYVPYRSLLPRGLEGLLVVGRCKSAENDALPLVRMQSDVANEGYAAGVAGAMCAKANTALRNVDMKALQDHLRSVGNLPDTNICVDMPEPTDDELRKAADDPSVPANIATLLAAPARSIPFLLESFQKKPSEPKAKALCFCGDTNGVEYLANWLDKQALTRNGKNGQVLPVDSAIRALGYARDARALPALTAKLADCTAAAKDSTHVRALVLSLGDIGSPQAAPALLAFIEKAGMPTAVRTVDKGRDAIVGSPDYKTAAQELIVATALYRCGDTNNTAQKILSAYLDDWRGPLHRFAAEILSGKPGGAQ